MPNIIEGVQNGLRRIGDAAKNARVDYDFNPFNDSKAGISVRSGRHQLNIGIGVDAEQGAGEADKLGDIGINANVSRDGVGTAGIGVGIGGKSGLLPDPELTIKNAQERTLITSSLESLVIESGKSLWEGGVAAVKSDLEAIRLRKILAEMEANSRQRQSQPQQRQSQPQQRQSQPQQRQSQPQQRQSQPQQKSSGNGGRIQSPNLPQGTPQTIPRFPTQGSAENAAAEAITRNRSSGTRLAPEPFQIPTDIPKTNTRLPKKPQIGGNTAQQNSRANQRNSGIVLGGNAPRQNSRTSQRNGGISLGGNGAPQQDNRVNQRNSGRRIVSPEELEDISANNPNNKPRINQPPEKSEPDRAYRLLTQREKQLFNCIQNGGGDACNKKYGESPQAKASGSSGGDNEVSLQFGDPYIGLGNF